MTTYWLNGEEASSETESAVGQGQQFIVFPKSQKSSLVTVAGESPAPGPTCPGVREGSLARAASKRKTFKSARGELR
jgi:hypothetical protein